jgi:hypothetical protein
MRKAETCGSCYEARHEFKTDLFLAMARAKQKIASTASNTVKKGEIDELSYY